MEYKWSNTIIFSKYIFPFFSSKHYCTPPKCGELSEYTDSDHIQVDDLSSRYIPCTSHYCKSTEWYLSKIAIYIILFVGWFIYTDFLLPETKITC